jgi:DNA-binding MarR family transcriptional regulator
MSDLHVQAIQQLGRTYRAMMAGFEANIGVTMSRWRILLYLHQHGEASQKRLASELGVDPAALTSHINAIHQEGWVERHSDPADNRLTNVALTTAGEGVVQDALPRRSAFIESLFAGLGDRQTHTLTQLLGALEQRLR